MLSSHNQPPFAIYHTPKGIELRKNSYQLYSARLICTCHLYASAERIAKTMAQTQKIPLLICL